jgi:hypothetical protein
MKATILVIALLIAPLSGCGLIYFTDGDGKCIDIWGGFRPESEQCRQYIEGNNSNSNYFSLAPDDLDADLGEYAADFTVYGEFLFYPGDLVFFSWQFVNATSIVFGGFQVEKKVAKLDIHIPQNTKIPDGADQKIIVGYLRVGYEPERLSEYSDFIETSLPSENSDLQSSASLIGVAKISDNNLDKKNEKKYSIRKNKVVVKNDVEHYQFSYQNLNDLKQSFKGSNIVLNNFFKKQKIAYISYENSSKNKQLLDFLQNSGVISQLKLINKKRYYLR